MSGLSPSSCACGKSAGSCGSSKPAADVSRRSFLKDTASFATAALAPGITLMAFPESAEARGPNEKVSSKTRWGMLVDTTKCADGCTACVTACSTENGWKDTGHPETDAQWIRKVTLRNPKNGTTRSLPVMCQHCASPPCVDVCPTGASFKRADGIVLVDKHLCIGCRYCMMACPYKARSFIHESLEDQKPHAPRGKGTVESCTLCVHRVDSGRAPACVEACGSAGHRALVFGDLNDPKSDVARAIAEAPVSQIRADLGVDPGVLYRGI